uniref:Polyketide synthase n=1 Tax=Sorangium cellulosum TaxID=56 RepID=I0J6Y6_SORCE|nr:polyketide synthase [Sorangium cellulosum]
MSTPDVRALLKNAFLRIEELESKLATHEAKSTEPVAIVAVACRFPAGARDPEAFWRALEDGVDGVRRIPADRWPAEAVGVDRPEVRWAGLLDAVDGMDAAFFGISPREAVRLDPQQRMLLEVTWEALERGGQRVDRLLGSKTGVFVGMCSTDYGQFVRRAASHDVYSGTGNMLSTAAGRVSYTFGLQGPSMTIDTACSSSLVAVHLACQSLRNRESDLAIAGGVSAILDPSSMSMMAETQALSPDGRCKTFDAEANGFVRGEGCGLVVLKRLSDAERDGDPILAVIRGSAVNQDGRSTGLTAPNVLSQKAMLRQALENARISAEDIGYVETHGTGTSLGDPIELEALRAVLGKPRADGAKCVLGALKTNVGHLEAAAGVAGLIKAVLCLERGAIPKNLHFQTLNPRIDLAGTPFVIPTENVGWEPSGKPRRAGVSAFGISGTNAHVIVEEAPSRQAPSAAQEASSYLLPLSAKSAAALTASARSWQQWLTEGEGKGQRLHDLAYTASVRRSHHEHRLGVVGTSKEEIAGALEAYARGDAPAGVLPGRAWSAAPQVVFVFPGQGSQWVGMGKRLLEEEPVFRAAVEACDGAILREAGFSVVKELKADERASRLGEIDVVQPVLFAMEVGLSALWRSWGVEPAAVVGHSMGEVAAAHVAGALTLEDAAAVICRRSRLLRKVSGKGAMALVELSLGEAEAALSGYAERLSVAVSNGPRSTVIAGEPSSLEEVLSKLEGQGVFCRRVKVDVASHSPQMDVLRSELLGALSGLSPKEASVPMWSTVTGERLRGEELVSGYWADNLRKPVLFSRVVRGLLEQGPTLFVELSPHPILVPALEENLREGESEGAAIGSLRRQLDERRTLLESLGRLYEHGAKVTWQSLYPQGGQSVLLPAYPWQKERYWIEDASMSVPGARQAPALKGDPGSHPLLGGALTSSVDPQAHFWELHLSLRALPYLKDHAVQGAVLFPGSGYIEMALAAGAELYGTAEIVLEDVSLEAMLIFTVKEEQRVQVVLTEQGDGRASFQISSRRDDRSWQRHASGTLRVGDAAARATPSLDLHLARARCTEEIAAAELYRQMAERGLLYGPAFQGVEQLWRGPGEALGRVRLPAEVAQESGAYSIHPALLDACFQVLGGLSAASEPSSYVLNGLTRLHTIAAPGRELWVRARRSAEQSADDVERVFELDLVGDDGRVLVELQGLRVHRLDAGVAARDPLDECVYAVEWHRGELAPRAPAAGASPRGGAWLVFLDQKGTGTALRELLSARGEASVGVLPAERYARLQPDLYQIDLAEPEHYRRLLREAFGDEEEACRGAIHLFSLDAAPWEQTTAETLDADVTRGSLSALYVAQALLRRGWRDAPRLWLVTRGAQKVGAGDGVAVSQAPLWGLGRTIALEHPELRCTRVDLSPAASAEEVTALVGELWSQDGEDQIALRDHGRHVARLVQTNFNSFGAREPKPDQARRPLAALQERGVRVRPDGAYLIAGGLGGLGLTVARWLVEQGARHVALMGRSAPSAAAEEAISAMKAAGAEVLVVRADVSRHDDVARTLAEIDARLAPLRGVVHTAVNFDNHPVLGLSEEHFRRALSAKMHGAWNLHALTSSRECDFFILYSSVSVLLGLPGLGNYLAANAFLDALAEQRQRAGLCGMSIQWGVFSEAGVAAARDASSQRYSLSDRGLGSLTPIEGTRALSRLLGRPAPNVAVARLNARQLFEFYTLMAQIPFYSRLRQDSSAASAGAGEAGRFRRTLDAAAPGEQRKLLEEHLREQVGKVLHMPPARIDRDAPFSGFGMDSVMSLELRNRLEVSLGLKLSATLLFTYPSLAALATYLMTALSPAGAPKKPAPRGDAAAGADAASLERIKQLTDSEMAALLEDELGRMKEYFE